MSNNNMSLYDISTKLLEIFEKLEESEGEITDAEYREYLKLSNTHLPVKVGNYVRLIKSLEAQAEATRAEARRLADLAKARENRINRVKDRLKMGLVALGQKSVDTAVGKVTVAKSGNPAVEVLVDLAELEKIDASLVVTKITKSPNKQNIKKLCQEAAEVGKELGFARLRPSSTYIKIT